LDIWIVTDRHIYAVDQIGLFDRTVRTIALERIEEINVRTEGVLQTFFGYGTIEVHTASPNEDDAVFRGIPDPQIVRSLILDQIEQLPRLERENEALQATAKDQEKLIHMVGHEVKTYLTKSAGALAAIAGGDLGAVPDDVQKMAGAALAETRKGVTTVSDILHGADTSKGTLAMERRLFDLKSMILEAARALEEGAHRKGLSYDLLAEAGDYTFLGDEHKLREQVFRNLIENSIRYTPQGSIHMELTKPGGKIRFSITDTGVGISAEDMPKLFTEGGHGTHSKEVNPDSTGFGLSIAKQITEAHGGRIWAESKGVGTGSTFVVELPTS
jgi:signal transduction histidine kinase